MFAQFFWRAAALIEDETYLDRYLAIGPQTWP